MSGRELRWLLMNVVGVSLHVLASQPLWTPPGSRGQPYYGGPGDGLYFLILLLLPAVTFGFINVAALFWMVYPAFQRRSGWPVLAYGVVLGLWSGALLFERHAMTAGIRLGS